MADKHTRFLYIGSLDERSNSKRRYQVFTEICGATISIDTDPYILAKYIAGFQHHLNIGPGVFLLNRQIKKIIEANEPFDIVLVDNKSYVSAAVLKYIKKKSAATRIANLLTDDPFGRFGASFRTIKSTAFLYDIIFVQRTVNVEELYKSGAKKVALCFRSFDPAFHRPLQNSNTAQRTRVGFIGTYEQERAAYIAFLIQQQIPVSVTGDGWPGQAYWEIIKPFYRGPSVYGEGYIEAINSYDIVLHFLRHANRDEQDSRTFEIPACKKFMLAEWSALHASLFTEKEEADFFRSREELLKKTIFYLDNKKEAERIAMNGYNKSYSAGYDHRSRLQKVITQISGAGLLAHDE